MAQPDEKGQVIHLEVGDDTIPSSRKLIIQSMYAEGTAEVTDGGGNTIWNANAAGDTVEFPCGLYVAGLNATGSGPVYVYIR